jgi:heat shock protein HslJ
MKGVPVRVRDAAILVLLCASAVPAVGQTPPGSPRLICFGNEPNWSVAFVAPGQARVTTPNASPATYRGRETRQDPLRESVWRGTAAGRRGDLVLLMREAPCSDGMSDLTHPVIARLSLADGAFLAGCCRNPEDQTEAAMLEGTTWRLTSLPGVQSTDLAALKRRVTLHLAEGRVTGFSGCNLMTGTYTTKGTSVTLNLAGTLMACPEPASTIERTFLQALKGPLSHTATADRLTLKSSSGAALEFEREPTLTLEGRTWNVTQFNNGRQAVVSVLPETRLTLSFAKGALSGQAGCNTFKASFTVKGNTIKVGPAATTRKMCADPVMTQERQFLAALQSVTRWAIQNGELDMHRGDGERALSATPSDAK